LQTLASKGLQVVQPAIPADSSSTLTRCHLFHYCSARPRPRAQARNSAAFDHYRDKNRSAHGLRAPRRPLLYVDQFPGPRPPRNRSQLAATSLLEQLHTLDGRPTTSASRRHSSITGRASPFFMRTLAQTSPFWEDYAHEKEIFPDVVNPD